MVLHVFFSLSFHFFYFLLLFLLSDQQPSLSTTKICDIVSDKTLQQFNNEICGSRDDNDIQQQQQCSTSSVSSSSQAINIKIINNKNLVPKQQTVIGDTCSSGSNCGPGGRRPHLVSRGTEFLPQNLIRSNTPNSITNNNNHCCNNNTITTTTTTTSTLAASASSSPTLLSGHPVNTGKRSAHKNNK